MTISTIVSVYLVIHGTHQDFLSAKFLRDRLDSLLITDEPFASGYRLQANDGRLNWYFDNLGLIPLRRHRPLAVRAYLDLYLKNIDADACTINDVRDIATGARQPPDSDDSYAATMLSLAVRSQSASDDQRWWDTNVARLKLIARNVLLGSQKPSGLVTVFAHDKERTTAYLMDNCEVYRGLADFAEYLNKKNDLDSREFAIAAARVAQGIANLYDEKSGMFRVADIAAGASFYPLRAAQVFPQVFGVPLGNKAQTQSRYDAAWAFMLSAGDHWEVGDVKDGSLGGYPWMVLGYAAAKRGRFDLARTQLNFFEDKLKTAAPPPPFTAINELGWALRTRDLIRFWGRE